MALIFNISLYFLFKFNSGILTVKSFQVGIELNISREDLMTDTSKTQSPAEVYLVDSKGNRIKLVNRPLSTLPKEDYLFAPNFDIAVITNQQGEERRYTFDELRKEYQISLNNAYLANRGKNTMPKQK